MALSSTALPAADARLSPIPAPSVCASSLYISSQLCLCFTCACVSVAMSVLYFCMCLCNRFCTHLCVRSCNCIWAPSLHLFLQSSVFFSTLLRLCTRGLYVVALNGFPCRRCKVSVLAAAPTRRTPFHHRWAVPLVPTVSLQHLRAQPSSHALHTNASPAPRHAAPRHAAMLVLALPRVRACGTAVRQTKACVCPAAHRPRLQCHRRWEERPVPTAKRRRTLAPRCSHATPTAANLVLPPAAPPRAVTLVLGPQRARACSTAASRSRARAYV